MSAIDEFAASVGAEGAVTIEGGGTRGGSVPGVRCVSAPSGVRLVQPEEMTAVCGAGTPVAELVEALAEHGQTVAIPPNGTVGGALAVGRSGLRRLGRGPIRDTLLQARFVGADGHVVSAGGPTVKNVSGFDLCRLLVGSRGTLGFLAEVILRTWPRPPESRWFESGGDPVELLGRLYRPASVLWDGATTWVCLEGSAAEVAAQSRHSGLVEVAGPPPMPDGGRWSVPPTQVRDVVAAATAVGERVVAEVGVGIVHHVRPAPASVVQPAVRLVHARIKHEFDPAGRLNPGVELLSAG